MLFKKIKKKTRRRLESRKSEYTERGRGRGVSVSTNAEERVRVKIWRARHRGRQTESKVEEVEIDAGVDMERGREKGEKKTACLRQIDRGRRKRKHRNWGKRRQ